jgi:hypothetical protein
MVLRKHFCRNCKAELEGEYKEVTCHKCGALFPGIPLFGQNSIFSHVGYSIVILIFIFSYIFKSCAKN